jgi:hypothetical protein
MTDTTAASRYQALSSIRQPVLDRARECAALTLPFLIPPEGSTEGVKLPTPYQSVGARGVIALTAKTLTTTLPPNTPFFRLDIEEYTLKELSQNPGLRSEIEAGLAMVERTASLAIESSNLRVGVHESLQHLVVSGNVLMHVMPDKGMRVFGLDNFVCLRDPSGNPIEIIAKEIVAKEALPDGVAEMLPEKKKTKRRGLDTGTPDNHTLYTHLRRVNARKWDVVQWVDDMIIESTRGSYPVDLCPWLPLRWNRIDGESYGRGHVESYLGDIKTLEALSKAIVEFAAGAAKVIALVNPNGITSETDLSEAENFEFVSGLATDVSFMRIDKYADLNVAKTLADDLTRRLEQAFLMGSSIQRQGERVTAEEIRYMAAELEATIGGVYALLSQELQLPLVNILLHQLTKSKRLPPLPKGVVTPTITTGLDALSRANDLVKLDRLVAGLRDLYGPEALAQETNVGDYIKRRAAALGMDIDGLIKSDEQKAAEAEARQQREMMQQLGPNMINAAGGMMQKGMEPPNE